MIRKEVFIEARKMIENKDNWCQGGFGIKSNNEGKRVKRCVGIAISDCTPFGEFENSTPDYVQFMLQVLEIPHNPPDDLYQLFLFNDTHTHAEVLAALDKAIDAASKLEEKSE